MWRREHSAEYMAEHADIALGIGREVCRLAQAPWAQEVIVEPMAGGVTYNIAAPPVNELTSDFLKTPFAAGADPDETASDLVRHRQRLPGLLPHMAFSCDELLILQATRMTETNDPGAHPWRRTSDMLRLSHQSIRTAAHLVPAADAGAMFVTAAVTTVNRTDIDKQATGYSLLENHGGIERMTKVAVMDGEPYAMSMQVSPEVSSSLYWRVIGCWSLGTFSCVQDILSQAVETGGSDWRSEFTERAASKEHGIRYTAREAGDAGTAKLDAHRTKVAHVMGMLEARIELMNESLLTLNGRSRVPNRQSMAELLERISAVEVSAAAS